MKHFMPTFFILFSVLLFVLSIKPALAISLISPFGGKIINEESLQIQTAKETNFTCHVSGKTITIKPVGGYPTEYYIPTLLLKSGLKKNSWILGKYSTKPYLITCTFNGFPPNTRIVNLKEITMYGTSK